MKIQFRIVDNGRIIDCGDFGIFLNTSTLDIVSYYGSRMNGMSQKKVCNLKRVCKGFDRKKTHHILVQHYYKLDFFTMMRRVFI